MSTNNYILIDRKNFQVSVRDADTGGVLSKIAKGKTLNNAVDIAMEYQETQIVEYGIQFTKITKNYVK